MSLPTVIDRGDNRRKTDDFRPDPDDQRVLLETNRQLQPLEIEYYSRAATIPDPELVLISYVPRSGSTLLSQLLASSGQFNYISNFQARFWLAPYIGGMLERNVAPRDPGAIPLSSRYGLTTTSGSPSEFSYFWRHWLRLDVAETDTLTDQHWSRLDIEALRLQLRLIGSLHSGPLMFKKEWLGMNAGHFLRAFPTARVIHVQRRPSEVALSIYKARQEVYGDANHWWASRPSNVTELGDLPWPEQIAGQIQGILLDVSRWLPEFGDRFVFVDYDRLVSSPAETLHRLCQAIGLANVAFPQLPEALPTRSTIREPAVVSKLQQALAHRHVTWDYR